MASSVGEAPICSKHLAAVLEQPYDQGSFDGADEVGDPWKQHVSLLRH